MAAVTGVAALDASAALRQPRSASGAGYTLRLEKSIAVYRSPDEVYQFWRDFEIFPRFMKHLESIAVIDSQRPGGSACCWPSSLENNRKCRSKEICAASSS